MEDSKICKRLKIQNENEVKLCMKALRKYRKKINPGPKKELSKYAKFVKDYAAKHPGESNLMVNAAKSWSEQKSK